MEGVQILSHIDGQIEESLQDRLWAVKKEKIILIWMYEIK